MPTFTPKDRYQIGGPDKRWDICALRGGAEKERRKKKDEKGQGGVAALEFALPWISASEGFFVNGGAGGGPPPYIHRLYNADTCSGDSFGLIMHFDSKRTMFTHLIIQTAFSLSFAGAGFPSPRREHI